MAASHISPLRPPGEECYVVLDKGAITDTHALVLPVEHYPSTLALPPSAAAELDQ